MVLIFAVEPREEERHVTRKAESRGELRLPGQAERSECQSLSWLMRLT